MSPKEKDPALELFEILELLIRAFSTQGKINESVHLQFSILAKMFKSMEKDIKKLKKAVKK